MKSFKCHKTVQAGKILGIAQTERPPQTARGSWLLNVATDETFSGYQIKEVSHDWYTKHGPKVGGYYVVYEDGYASFSPADEFKGGYTVIEPATPGVAGPQSATGQVLASSSDRLEVGSDEYLDEVFRYHAPDADQQARYQNLRLAAKTFAQQITVICPASPDRTDAFRKLRECVMTANASIALKGRA